MRLTAAQKRALREDGFVVLRGAAPRALTAPVIREINNRLGAGVHPGKDAYADTHDYLSEYVGSEPVLALARGAVAGLADELLGPGRAEPLSQAQIVLRFPAPGPDEAYEPMVHIDGPYSGMDGAYARPKRPLRYAFNAGVFLSDTPAPGMGNLAVYPGTHRAIARLVARRGVPALKGAIDRKIPMPAPVQVTGRTGDVVIFHFLTAHDKTPNFSPHIRRMAYFRVWHRDAWNDLSPGYLRRAIVDPWLEWGGLKARR